MSGRIRYGVVGAGQIAQQAFMPGVARTDNSTLSALVTGDPIKAEALGAQYRIKVYSYADYETLLRSGEIDAVYVATPNSRHTDYVIAALEAGIHVLLEKPMASSVDDAEAMRAAQDKGLAKLMVAYRLHHEPGTVDLVTRAQAGDFGDLRAFSAIFAQKVDEANSRGHNGYWGGPVPDMGTYPLNAVRNLFGDEPISVFAVGTKTPGRDFNFADTVSVTLRFPDDRLAQFTVSYATSPVERITLIGAKATVEVSPCFTFGPEIAITYVEKTAQGSQTHRFEPVDQFANETQYFSDCILNDRRPEADAEEGLLDMRVLDAIKRSLDTGTIIGLEPVTRRQKIIANQSRAIPAGAQPSDTDLINVIPLSG